ncbi:ABC transporter substrate-binding protein [Streptomyces sp. 8L]|uniref:ABC transporter substrate-binding protein n=1 Tax=Streptomyces sp. 8L TaxID=2877242 RepID=UPI001CD25E05|nr:iron-siderophore ABC transporter substrate-binding protein [Streptomyces sp. 8L]MCA1218371.1 iron-siderophore ABC transporter substrate-binding protein [Streptomyces sp. 8L]
MRRLLLTAVAATTGVLALAACGSTQPAADGSTHTSKKITLTDATGARVTLDGPAKKVVSTEWFVTEDLASLGVKQAGAADVKGYRQYDSAVPLPNTPKDIGTRGEPSMDTVASLAPDLIIATTDLSSSAIAQLKKVAPVLELRSANAADQIGQMRKNLDTIARATGRTPEATALEKKFDSTLADGRKRLSDAGLDGTDVAFADGYVASNQVTIRPFTSGSLFGTINGKLGLKNAWTVKGDKDYGLASTDVEGLTKLGKDTRFVYGRGADNPFDGALRKNSVWKSLPFVKAGHLSTVKNGIWSFGGYGSSMSYVGALVDALVK